MNRLKKYLTIMLLLGLTIGVKTKRLITSSGK